MFGLMWLALMAVVPAVTTNPLDAALARSRGLEPERSLVLLDSLLAADADLREANHPRAANLWHQRATNLHILQGPSPEVETALERAIRGSGNHPDPEEPLSDLEYEYGFILLRLGKTRESAEAWSRAIEALRSEGDDPPTRLWWQSNLAEARRQLGEISTAEALLRETVEESRGLVDDDDSRVLHATLLNNLGALFWDQNRLLHAERLYRESLEMIEGVDRSALEPALASRAQQRLVTAYLNLGVVLRDQERLGEARELHRAAVELAEATLDASDGARIFAEAELGNSLDRIGAFDEAEVLWQRALEGMAQDGEDHRVDRVELQHVRARALLEHGRLEAAERASTEALRLARASVDPGHPILGYVAATRAHVLAAHEPMDAQALLAACDSALALLEAGRAWPSARAETLVHRGHALHALGRIPAAIESMEAAWKLIERLRPERGTSERARHQFMRAFAEDASALVGWYVERGQPWEAVATAERFRSRLLQDELRLDRVDLRQGIEPERLASFEKREASLRARIASAQRALRGGDAGNSAEELDDALSDLGALEDEIRLASPGWLQALVAEDWSASRDVVDATLYFELGEDASYVFYIPPGGGDVEVHPLGERLAAGGVLDGAREPLLLSLIDESVRGVVGLRPAERRAAAAQIGPEHSLAVELHELFRALIPAALWEEISQLAELTIVPDGDLFSLPFEALVVRDPDEGGIRYWLDEGPALRYAPALREIARRGREDGSRELAVLSVSDPHFGRAAIPSLGGRELASLPGTKEESAAVARAFQGQPSLFLSQDDATEAAVREAIPRARFIHIATHGLVDRGSDSRLATLALTPGNTEELDDDGLLQLFEIYDLDLDCELAVLSACDTRTGQRLEGEAAHALSRGFHVAGAQQVIASLWPVDDRSTSALVGRLFEGLAEARGKNEAAAAARLLRDAKLELRRDARWSHPVHWAAFLLSGRAGAR